MTEALVDIQTGKIDYKDFLDSFQIIDVAWTTSLESSTLKREKEARIAAAKKREEEEKRRKEKEAKQQAMLNQLAGSSSDDDSDDGDNLFGDDDNDSDGTGANSPTKPSASNPYAYFMR